MQIRLIDVNDDVDFQAWFDVYDATSRADFPDGPRWRTRELQILKEGYEAFADHLWVADDDGAVVGAAALGLPLLDNLKLGEPEVFVHPDARRRGIGSTLLSTVEDAARANGRSSLMTYIEGPTDSPETPGTAFAEARGFTRRITEIARTQRPPFDLDTIDSARREASAKAAGYRLVTWRDRVSDEYVEELARLEGRMSTDAPLGELDYEPEVWGTERLRYREERNARMGRGIWCAAAIAPDGSMAGVTRIALADDSDETAFQDTTIVDPRHRGHRLGLLLKAANFQALHADRPGVEAVWTWNADSNTHMIAINETLGYRVAGWSAGYQRDI